MNNSFSLPPQSAEIFDRLSKGLFISQNSPSSFTSDLYRVVESHFNSFESYFQVIGFQLERGKGYFFFSKKESKSQIEDKAEKLFRYLDGLEILFLLEPKLRPGLTFDLLSHAETLDKDKSLKKKALLLPGKIGQEHPVDRIRNFCKSMDRESFFLTMDEAQNEFLVLDAFNYLVDFFKKIDQNI